MITASETTPLTELARLLLENGIKRVPILRGDRVVGIVSRTDLIRGQLAAETRTSGNK